MIQAPIGVLLLNTQMELAGAQKAMLELAHGLKARGHHVVVVTMYDKTGCIDYLEDRYRLKIINLGMKRPAAGSVVGESRAVLQGVWRLYSLMRTEDVRVLQTFSHYSNILGPVIGWLAGVAVRVSSQRMSLAGHPAWLLWLDRTIANSSMVQQMVAVSEGTRRFCIEQEHIRSEKLVTVHNGIDVKSFAGYLLSDAAEGLRNELGLRSAPRVLTTVARLHPQKGHRFLIKAMPQILGTLPGVHLLLVGEGELREELELAAATYGVRDYVHLLGSRTDVPRLLAISDLFVLPSLWEGLPNSVLEAMAAGLAVVATDVDGCSELVVNGKTGVLVRPGNADVLAAAITSLLLDDKRRQAMGQAGRERVAAYFSQEATVTAFEELYGRLLAGVR
jgi:glycosyltransferase involved in cell wall biosynthesis